jgi:hypothetical protein
MTLRAEPKTGERARAGKAEVAPKGIGLLRLTFVLEGRRCRRVWSLFIGFTLLKNSSPKKEGGVSGPPSSLKNEIDLSRHAGT